MYIYSRDTALVHIGNKLIKWIGFPSEVINALRYLTHNDDVKYLDYVRKIKENKIAMKVKIADLKHNSDMSRLDNPTPYDYERAEKYKKALAILLD